MLEPLTSPALRPLRHGFFTRAGGASSGIFAGLNCGFASSDQREAVAINRARVATAIGVAPEALALPHQVHSALALVIEAPLQRPLPQVDALVTARRGLAIGVLTADCQPVLFADAAAGVIGAAHAGWKGALSGVLEATLAAMERLGAQRARIGATIGPCISRRAYEVGPEFVQRFRAEDAGGAAVERFFTEGEGGRFRFDLPGYSLARLRAAGVAADWLGRCTYSEPDRFYSYRRSVHRKEADYGRQISVIRL